jgi:DNA-binding NtrC family response regulator
MWTTGDPNPRPETNDASNVGITDLIVGTSEPMRHLRATIEMAAPSRLPVLIQGPTGSGKELVAAAIHARSGRRGPLVAFNVCAIGDSMFEDALFGHVRGAFTGAANDTPGYLREANAGTVFMDEVSGLPATLQAKLLRALDSGVFRPIGARIDVRSDFRLVSASNEAPYELVASGRFRSDFAHRIGAVLIQVPSLEERLEDIPALVRHFLRIAGSGHLVVDEDVYEALQSHAWSGNVRELRQVVELAAAISDRAFSAAAVRAAMTQHAELSPVGNLDVLSRERTELRRVLADVNWNVAAAAERLGVHRATVYRRMHRVGISRSQH